MPEDGLYMTTERNISFPISVESLLPHKPPMLMVDSILNIDDTEKSSVIESTIRPEFPFISKDYSLEGEAFIEIMAQAAAAQHGYNLKRNKQREEKGFIVGIRKFKIESKVFVGDRLEVFVQLGPEIESLSVVFGTVSCKGKKVASAELTVWHGESDA